MAARLPPRRRTSRAVPALLLAAVLATACSDDSADPADPTVRPEPTTVSAEDGCATSGLPTTVAYRRVEGVDLDLTSLDVHGPADACRAPVVVWVHGGGYRIGDKANDVDDKIRLFGERGWLFVSVNYRLTDPSDPSTARFPDHYDDVASAVAWVHANIADYGGDPGRIALLGHSAGADIVSNVVIGPDYLAEHDLTPSDLACVGPLDSEGFDKVTAGDADIRGLEKEWIAALANEPRFRERTSATLLLRPGLDLPPFITVVRGGERRRSIQEAFARRLREVGTDVTVIDAARLTHREVNARIGARGDEVMTPPLVRFLTDCFATG